MRIKKECILILLRSFRREFQHIMKKQAKNQLLEIRLDGLINDSIADNNKKNGKNTFIITFLNHKNILKFWPDICWDHKIVKTKRKLEWKKKKKKKERTTTEVWLHFWPICWEIHLLTFHLPSCQKEKKVWS